MTPTDFVRKWSDSSLRESQASQSHFNDLCALLEVLDPVADDPRGERYCFERGAEKTGGGDGWADVWKRGCFGWEYKGRHANLDAALKQLTIYAGALENPPLLVVSDMDRIRVHTHFTNTVPRAETFTLEDLLDPAKRDRLRAVWTEPERFRPSVNRQELTAKAAARFGALGRRLQERKTPDGGALHEPRAIAHFLNQLVFCMFAERAGLLPLGLFTRTLKATAPRPLAARAQLRELFRKMANEAEEERYFGPDLIRWFNGGLFDQAEPLMLERIDLEAIAKTAEEHDWSEIDPSIFGTLFEEALKATRERPALGAHYTDRDKILNIVKPVITDPLRAEWASARAEIAAAAEEARAADAARKSVLEAAAAALKVGEARAGEAQRRREIASSLKARDAALVRTREALERWLQRLAAFRVLDPACGSGNFLYVALHALRDLEAEAILDFERTTGMQGPAYRVGLQALRGIEIDRYAAELARLTLWIGDLQWTRAHVGATGYAEPLLSTLDQIENRDAILDPDGGEAAWPEADVIIGNPPFVGGKKLRETLGDAAVERLFSAYKGRVPAEADLVCYWVEKAWRIVSLPRSREGQAGAAGQGGPKGRVSAVALPSTDTCPPDPALRPGHPPDKREGDDVRVKRAGLVATNSIRGGANRRVLDPIAEAGAIFDAWSDQPWTQEGAAVRVSMVCFGEGFAARRLDGREAARINADLTAGAVDLTRAKRLKQNAGVSFIGIQKTGPFEVEGDQARRWLAAPMNPNGKSNSEVLRPYWNGLDVTRRSRDSWIIDFTGRTEQEAALYELPFQHALVTVEPVRRANKVSNPAARAVLVRQWWLFWRARPELLTARAPLLRTIVSPEVAKHRVFVWADRAVGIDKNLIAIARDDDTTFGILHARPHELWALRMGTSLEDRPRYTPSTTFETFPFPEGLTPDIPAADYADDPRARAIAEAAAELDRLRNAWLNPSDLVRVEPEVVPGYPDRVLPKDDEAAKVLKTRTLTNLYNQRPTWLADAHRALDAAVAAAYGWTDWGEAGLPEDEILARLFALNQARAG